MLIKALPANAGIFPSVIDRPLLPPQPEFIGELVITSHLSRLGRLM